MQKRRQCESWDGRVALRAVESCAELSMPCCLHALSVLQWFGVEYQVVLHMSGKITSSFPGSE